MSKRISKYVKQYLDDVAQISSLKTVRSLQELHVEELPFDRQMLALSPLYRASRKHYLALGGTFTKKICSTLRSLSSDDIFKNEVEYSPAESEVLWFAQNPEFVSDADAEVLALQRFNDISIFHEQNHRVVWKLLPAAPADKNGFRRFLNFAESAVVTLDAALGDELGPELSMPSLRLNLLYRPAGDFKTDGSRNHLIAFFCATYFLLDRVHKIDILKAVNYLFQEQKALNRQAVARALELNESFTDVTNPQWQALYWQKAAKKLQVLNKKSKKPVLLLPQDPLDLGAELELIHDILDYFDQSHPLSQQGKSGKKDKKIRA